MEEANNECKKTSVLSPVIVITQRCTYNGKRKMRDFAVFSEIDKAAKRFDYMFRAMQHNTHVRIWKRSHQLKTNIDKSQEGAAYYNRVTMFKDGAKETDYCELELKAMNIAIQDIDDLISQLCSV